MGVPLYMTYVGMCGPFTRFGHKQGIGFSPFFSHFLWEAWWLHG